MMITYFFIYPLTCTMYFLFEICSFFFSWFELSVILWYLLQFWLQDSGGEMDRHVNCFPPCCRLEIQWRTYGLGHTLCLLYGPDGAATQTPFLSAIFTVSPGRILFLQACRWPLPAASQAGLQENLFIICRLCFSSFYGRPWDWILFIFNYWYIFYSLYFILINNKINNI